MIIDQDTISSASFQSPFQITVGTSIVALSTINIKCKRGLQLYADPTNGGIIYIGRGNVATSTGYGLFPDKDIFIPIDNTDTIYLIASASGQKLYCMPI